MSRNLVPDTNSDHDCIDELIALGTAPSSITRIQDRAAKEMQRNGLGYTLHNACAATLSCFLNEAGIDVPITLGAGRLAKRLNVGRGWAKVEPGLHAAGDVGVTYDLTNPPGADHVFLVVECLSDDEMMIADNQKPLGRRHSRFVSGRGKTRTEYFLRPAADRLLEQLPRSLTDDYVPDQDEDTNDLAEPFEDDGSPSWAPRTRGEESRQE